VRQHVVTQIVIIFDAIIVLIARDRTVEEFHHEASGDNPSNQLAALGIIDQGREHRH
jgi:hypothetical protein